MTVTQGRRMPSLFAYKKEKAKRCWGPLRLATPGSRKEPPSNGTYGTRYALKEPEEYSKRRRVA